MSENKKIPIYHDLAKECTLLEALYYMAFDVYPLYLVQLSGADIRRDPEDDRKGEFGIFSEIPEDLILDNEKCKKYDLPENPYFLESEEDYLSSWLPVDVFIGEQNELGDKLYKDDPAGLQKWKEDLERKKIKLLDYQNNVEKWNRAIEAKLKEPKNKLLRNLIEGKVKACGKKLSDFPSEAKDTNNVIDEENWTYSLNEFFDVEFTEISNDFWKSADLEIDWKSSRGASFKSSYYAYILLNVEDLIKTFSKKVAGTNLNSIIKNTIDSLASSSGCNPKALDVWKEIKKNMANYSEVIIAMKEPYQITWRVANTGCEKTMKRKTFQNIVSKYSKIPS